MTPRTVSLLLLSVAALAMSALIVGALQRLALGSTMASPWMMPILALLCYSVTFFLGRRYLLPFEIAEMPGAAILLLTGMTFASLGFVYGVVLAARRFVDGLPGGVVLALWFLALWTCLSAVHHVVHKRRVR